MKRFALLSTRSRIWSDSDRWRNRCWKLFLRMTRNILNHCESCLHRVFNSKVISQRKRHWKMNVPCESLSANYQGSESDILGDWKSLQLKIERCSVKTCCSISTVAIWQSVDEKNCVVVKIQCSCSSVQQVGRCHSQSESVSAAMKMKTVTCIHAQVSNQFHSWIWICKTVREKWRRLSISMFTMIRKSFLSIKQIILQYAIYCTINNRSFWIYGWRNEIISWNSNHRSERFESCTRKASWILECKIRSILNILCRQELLYQ